MRRIERIVRTLALAAAPLVFGAMWVVPSWLAASGGAHTSYCPASHWLAGGACTVLDRRGDRVLIEHENVGGDSWIEIRSGRRTREFDVPESIARVPGRRGHRARVLEDDETAILLDDEPLRLRPR